MNKRLKELSDGSMSEKKTVQSTTFIIKVCLYITYTVMSVILIGLFVPIYYYPISQNNFVSKFLYKIYPVGNIVLQMISGLNLVYLFYCWKTSEIGLGSPRVIVVVW